MEILNKNDGIVLSLIRLFHKILNRLFVFMVFKTRQDIKIDYTAQINGKSNINIGKNFYAGKFLRLEAFLLYNDQEFNPRLIIKDNVIINDFVHIGCVNYIEIGNNVLMASKVYITDHNHGNYNNFSQSNPNISPSKRYIDNEKKVIIEDNVWLGESVSILPNVRIGKGSIIGANSVVCKDIPEYCIAVGSPAKVIKKFNFETLTWEKI